MENIQTQVKNITSPLLIIGSLEAKYLETLIKDYKDDVLVLDGKLLKVTEVREFIRWINLKPIFKEKKLVIFLNSEYINIVSANTILKTLEEPPTYAKIILNTLNEQRILPTIKSRCIKIKIPYKVDKIAPEYYLSPEELSKKSVKERFKWVDENYEKEDLEKVIALWQSYYQEKLKSGEDVLEILVKLIRARDLLLTNISVKLLLENLLLNYVYIERAR